MKRLNSSVNLIVCLGILVIAVLACKGSFSTNDSAANDAPAKTETPAVPKNIAGEYDAKGTNPNGAGTYEADLLVTKRDDVYQFSWNSRGHKYDGVGVMTDSAVAVAYADGTNGKGCGVVLYKINDNGSLDGKAGYWGVNTMETEKATRTSGSDLEGKYNISGSNTDGQDYKGTLEVSTKGQGYLFEWNAANTFDGFG
ncbi:MAG: hypothetical protein WAU71_01580, partial [Pyrinomonadaceae bacterium]